MNENARKLQAALRDPTYNQCVQVLKEVLKVGINCYCFAGLACEVYRLETKQGSWDGRSFILDGVAVFDTMPDKVRIFYGFKTAFATWGKLPYDGLVWLSDARTPFPVLADLMNKHKEKLFV